MAKCVERKVINPEVLFIDSTHMNDSANKNKTTIELVEEQGEFYQDELETEINKVRVAIGKSALKKKMK